MRREELINFTTALSSHDFNDIVFYLVLLSHPVITGVVFNKNLVVHPAPCWIADKLASR